MTTGIDRARLDRVLPPAAGQANWDDVIARAGVREARRPRRYAAVVLVSALVIAGTASALGAARTFLGGPDESPKVVYVHDGALYVINADGSGRQRLARAAGCCVAWSPDERSLAYTVGRDGIWVVGTDGTGRRRLARDGSFPAWSPDGRSIAYSGKRGIFVVNADGSGPRRRLVADGAAPLWSPDGQSIAFSRRGDLWVMAADATGQRNLTDSPGKTEAQATWSPDSSAILFVRRMHGLATYDTDGDFEIFLADAAGGGERRLTANGIFDGRASWAPDGSRIVFICGSEYARVCVMNDDGTHRRYLDARTRNDWPVAWSPDGKNIAYTAHDGSEITVMGTDGSNRRRLTQAPRGSVFVAWSPPGSRLGAHWYSWYKPWAG